MAKAEGFPRATTSSHYSPPAPAREQNISCPSGPNLPQLLGAKKPSQWATVRSASWEYLTAVSGDGKLVFDASQYRICCEFAFACTQENISCSVCQPQAILGSHFTVSWLNFSPSSPALQQLCCAMAPNPSRQVTQASLCAMGFMAWDNLHPCDPDRLESPPATLSPGGHLEGLEHPQHHPVTFSVGKPTHCTHFHPVDASAAGMSPVKEGGW